jgi:uncharacterized protein YdeI (YjbR/CyaY-like superfamily)
MVSSDRPNARSANVVLNMSASFKLRVYWDVDRGFCSLAGRSDTAEPAKNLPVILFKTPGAWSQWLSRNGATSPGVWMRIAKKDTSLRTISYQEALELALCYGWIDGQKRSLDTESWLQKFTRRKARSIWSMVNRKKADELVRDGRMKKAGLAAIESAKANGRWDSAYDSHKHAKVPVDLELALKARPKAKQFFLSLNAQNRYAILFRLQTAKKPETRQRRLDKFMEMLEKHETLYP